MSDDDLITVCASCSQASCWQGEFYCDDYKMADIKKMTRGELAKLGREHPSYWKTDDEWTAIWDAEAKQFNDARREARQARIKANSTRTGGKW